MPRILIVEDDPQISRSMKMNLTLSGYDAENVHTITDAWTLIQQRPFDLICLDIGLPDGSGLDLCESIRRSGNNVPVLFISALTDEATVVKGINRGADDYLRKPFGMEELKARMNKLIKKKASSESTINFGPLFIDPCGRTVKIMGQILALGKKELEILTMLAKKAGGIVSREAINSSVYENADSSERTIDSHMSHLRKKIKEVAGESIQIISVYGLGYRLQWKG